MFIRKTIFASAFLLFIVPAIQPALAEEKPGTISVNGTGTIKAAPDMAIISLGVVKEAKTARLALDENNKAMGEIFKALEAKGIEPRDLQTSGFNISPRYIYPKHRANEEPKPPRIVGYTVSNNLTVRIRKLDQTGEILDELVTLGVNTGGNIRFVTDNTDDLLMKARAKAMKNAKEKADTILTAAGVSLGRIQSISENARRPAPRPLARAKSFAVEAADAVPVAGGENSYEVTVNVVWEIAQ